ncbi:facilitated trehalose transporter Tret1 [Galendromus occidentalis]|uniref:Facilitated trehalose transporter Tret1 n=1 Tax=Galendromus occidentalis TaxID=34638 RepID=A0AAJ6QWJ9_9ACAR|nr:facilitated trehalose transporter Tret1 [Galendromus occidentalis]
MEGYTDPTETKPRYLLAVGSAYLGSYAVGAALGYSSPVTDKFVQAYRISDEYFGSVIALGALFGGLVASYPAEKLGRKFTILFSAAIFALGWTLMLIRSGPWMLYLSRAILGLAIGIDSMVVPVYLGEISPVEKRGILGAGHQLNCVIGILVTYIFGVLMGPSLLAITCIIPVVLNALAIFFMPESPTWLSKNKRPIGEIMSSLYFLYGRTVRAEAQRELLQEAQDNTANDFVITDLFHRSVLAPLLIALGIMLAQQGSGINAVVFYTKNIFIQAGVTSIDPGVQTIIVGFVLVVFTVPGALLMDKAGRRPLLLISSSATLFGTILFIVFYAIRPATGAVPGSIAWMPIAGLSIYVAGFACGLGPVPWLMMGELLPVRARGAGTGIATAFNWFCAFLVTFIFPDVSKSPGPHYAFAFFAVITVLGIAMVIFLVPETKGKSLEEIEALFDTRADLALSSVDTVETTNSFKIQ